MAEVMNTAPAPTARPRRRIKPGALLALLLTVGRMAGPALPAPPVPGRRDRREGADHG